MAVTVGVAAADAPPLNQGTVAKRTADLDRWLFEVRTANDADVASGAVQQATTAIARAREPGAKLDTVQRAQSIAEASLVLAERQMARQQAAAALLAAEERVANTRERANAQRRVLEALMRERATLALAEEEAKP